MAYGYQHRPRRNIAAGVAIATLAVVVGGLTVTGFVSPGFLVSRSAGTPIAAEPPSSEPTSEPPTSEPGPASTVSPVPPPNPVPPTSTAPAGGPTAGGEPVAPDVLAAMDEFLTAVNAGDAGAAKARLCQDAITTPEELDELVGLDPDLEIDPTVDGRPGTESVQLYLRGTAGGQEVSGYSTNLWVTSYDGPWCVHGFRLVVV